MTGRSSKRAEKEGVIYSKVSREMSSATLVERDIVKAWPRARAPVGVSVQRGC